MGTVKNPVDAGTADRQQFLHFIVHLLQVLFAVITARDTGVVTRNRHQIAGLLEPVNGFDAAWYRVPSIHGSDVVIGLVVDDAISIKDYHFGHSDLPPCLGPSGLNP